MIFNIIQMMLTNDIHNYVTIYKQIVQLCFSLALVSECIIKLLLYGFRQNLILSQYRLQFIITILYIIGSLSEYKFFLYPDYDLNTHNRINILFRSLSVLGLLPLLRMVERLKTLDKILRNIYFSIELLKNLLITFFITLYFYSIIGNIVFFYLSEAPVNKQMNFITLENSMVILFKVYSYDTWPEVYF
jgi:hypothetical protein